MNEKSWLDTATAKIRFRPDRRAVRRELEAHLEDLREHTGLTEEAALEAMGDPGRIAEELGRIHRPWLGYLWRASQIALAGTAVFCCLLAILAEAVYQPLGRLAGGLESLLAPVPFMEAAEEREVSSGMAVETGGYTIRAERAVLRRDEDGPWTLAVDLRIDLGWRREPLILQNAWSGARSSAGPCGQRTAAYSASWLFWQKACIAVEVPEDAEWAELDFGWGERRRTLRIDLTEEAET